MTKIRRKFTFVFLLISSIFCSISIKAQPHLSPDEVENLRTNIRQTTDSSQILNRMDLLALNLVNIDSMKTASEKELEMAIALSDTTYILRSLDRLGWSNNILGFYPQAHEYYTRMLHISEACYNGLHFAKALSGIGDAQLGLDNFERGLEFKRRALNILREINEPMEMAIIYRAIGKACLDYMQFQMAMENFKQALEIDITFAPSITATRNLGRDYHFIGHNTYEESGYTDKNTLIKAKRLLLRALQFNVESEDYIFQSQSCMDLSTIYTYLAAITKNWNYADSSLYYYNQGKSIREKSGYTKYKENYDIVHAMHLSLMGNRRAAIDILDRINKPGISTAIHMDLFRAYFFVHYFDKDWKGLFENFHRAERIRKQIYITEFFSKVSKINTISELEGEIYHLEQQYINNTNSFDREMNFHDKFTAYASITIFLFLVLMLTLGILYIHNKIVNERLSCHEKELLEVNEELTTLYNETKEQSEEIAAQTKEMKRQRNKLSTYNFKMMVHLGIGQRMQSYIVPSKENVKNIFGEAFVLWRPLEEVSGDFYWCSEISGLKVVSVADCTGHGIPGAFLSMLGSALLNSIVPRLALNANAAKILDSLRERMEVLMRRGATNQNEVHDGMDMALCIFDSQNGKLSYAGAYRPLWMMRDGNLTEFKPDKMPIAVDNDRKGPFTNYDIDIQKGDMFYIFSDGITDQYGRTADGKATKFKPKRLREFVEKIYQKSADEQANELETAINDWKGPYEQTDDMLVVGIKIN